jgi:hypothetical protein
LRESYTVFQTDLEAYLLKIYHDNKFVATQVYGHDPEPAQIMALIASLEKLYKSIPIQYGWPRFRYQRPQRSRAYPFPATRRQPLKNKHDALCSSRRWKSAIGKRFANPYFGSHVSQGRKINLQAGR